MHTGIIVGRFQVDQLHDGHLKLIMTARGHWSIDNIAFGMGGGLLQKVDRDTQRFAFKCSSITDELGDSIDVYKSPVGDMTKASKKGRLKLIREPGGFRTVSETDPGQDVLETVFENGELVKNYTFQEVRALARKD